MNYSHEAYYTQLGGLPDGAANTTLAEHLYARVFRTRFDEPGFALVGLGSAVTSTELRRWMVALKEALGDVYRRATGRHLVYLSMGRFDQQTTTKFHLDGAPDESFLMLGYEPSEVASELWTADHARAAYDLGITPEQFLVEHNPMFVPGEQRLLRYATRLAAFEPRSTHILLLNNSRLPFRDGAGNFLGVMHKATILTPRGDRTRIVNSTMLGAVEDVGEEPVSERTQQEFLRTNEVSGELKC